MADLRPRSYIVAPSPSAQYADLDASLEAQVVDSRKNLLEAFHDTPAFTLTLDDEQPLNLNEVGDEFLKVFLRIRPFTNEELANQEDKECIKVSNSTTICTTAPPESCAYRNAQHLGADRIHTDFVFTRVFGPDVQQREIFESITFDLMKQFVAGESSLLFSYGVTNSGKTHTIQGTDADPGLIPQTLNCLFAFAKDRLFGEVCFKPKLYNETVVCDDVDKRALMKQKESLLRLAEINEPDVFLLESTCNLTKALSSSESSLASSSSSVTDLNEICNTIDAVQLGRGFSGFKYSIWVSFVEIYNEYVYDLLDPVTNVKGKRRCALKLSEDKKGNIYIKNLIEINVNSCEEALKLLTFGQKNLRYASTKLNYNSSRSHCVFNLRLMRLAYKNGKIVVEKTSKFSFCDLAGSERTSKTGSTGDRVKEAGNINTSLLNLGRCINTLRHNQTHRDKAQIIPFRDSKLTRLFQNFLVGRGKACMIVNISQCASCFDETLQVLQFSALVKQVKQVKSRDDVAAEFERASQVPLIDEEDEDQEFSVLDTTLAAENNWAQTVQKYQSIIDYLRAQLLEERTKSLRIQEQVREELCEQFAAQMQEMNDNYLKIRREGMQEAEDAADERLELYIQTVKKRQNKERRVTLTANAGDEEEGWVPESLLAAERMKNEKNELLIKELQQKLSEVEKPAGDGLQTKIDADKTESFSDWLVSDSEGQSSSHKQELQIQLEKKIKECQDLEDMLNEAGETYKANEKEIDRLKSLVASLEADKESIASSKDERIAQLENLLQEPKGKSCPFCAPKSLSTVSDIEVKGVESCTSKQYGTCSSAVSQNQPNADKQDSAFFDQPGCSRWISKSASDKEMSNLENGTHLGRHHSTSVNERSPPSKESLPLSPIKGSPTTTPKIKLNDITMTGNDELRTIAQQKNAEIRDPLPIASGFSTKTSSKKYFRPLNGVHVQNGSGNRDYGLLHLVRPNRAFTLRLESSPNYKLKHGGGALDDPKRHPPTPVSKFFAQLNRKTKRSNGLKRISVGLAANKRRKSLLRKKL